jgi:phytoene dehydrogenase-like protein
MGQFKKKYDAVIVGGGHNGLTCAAYLAKAGKDVLVLEKRNVLGGAAVSEEVVPGFTFSVCSYVVSLFRPHIIRELELAKRGLEIIPLESSYSPAFEGPGLCRWGDSERSRREIAKLSQKDAEIYPEFGNEMKKMSFFAKSIIDNPAPDPASLNPGELLKMLKLGKHFKDMEPDMFYLHNKLLTMSALDFLDMYFESDVLKAPMAVSGIIGTFLGINSPGSAYVLLHHYLGEIDGSFRSWGLAKGGTGAISMAVADAALEYGAQIETGTGVASIKVQNGVARSVILENGDEIQGNAIISGCDPKRTFLNFVGEKHLDTDFTDQIKQFKMRGSSAKVNFALDRLPNFNGNREGVDHLRGDIALAPSTKYLEKAYDQAKYGEYSDRPYINIVFPSISDPSVAPAGKHVMSCFIQYAPYNINGGPQRWDAIKEEYGDNIVDTISDFAPDFKDCIIDRQVLTPLDLEREFGLTEGNIFHGELSLEQLLFLRPAAGWARYKTPVCNLWMCASGTHPGGGVMGGPGELAAKTILKTGEI